MNVRAEDEDVNLRVNVTAAPQVRSKAPGFTARASLTRSERCDAL